MAIPAFYTSFEQLLQIFFESFGFVTRAREQIRRREIDFVVERNGVKTFVEFKFYRSKNVVSSSVREVSRQLQAMIASQNEPVSGLLIISSYVPKPLKEEIENNDGIIIWDRNDLYNLIKFGLLNTQLLEDFEQLLNEAKQGIDTEDVFANTVIDNRLPGDYFLMLKPISAHASEIPPPIIRDYCRDLGAVFPGKPGWMAYELLNIEILKYLFEKDLSNWHTQRTTDDELSRFDMICRVISKNDFWKNLIQSFQSRYVLFEFKNYSDPIGQDQIYTTERYLYLRGLRSVGFIIAPKGGKAQAHKAAKGALREHGKLIIILSNEDLCKMLAMKAEGGEPSDYLSDRLDDFLISLSR
ncbi:MAG: hypothetical protein JWP45_442 [Mucilaginibacter sp.]|nr:hypothetical protein [Mucilaginibacter sp.]